MRCPSCGAVIKKRSLKCPECGAFRNRTWVDSESSLIAKNDFAETAVSSVAAKERVNCKPSLIEFPGVTRSSLPQWRKELGERVREVQERRAREAILEQDDGPNEDGAPAPVLELLPQTEAPPMNPLVAAALQRIERAHVHSSTDMAAPRAMAAAAVDYELSEPAPAHNHPGGFLLPQEEQSVSDPPTQPERVHNLAVVPSPAVVETELQIESQLEVPALPKPKRLIRDDLNDPALNYLDALPTTVGIDIRRNASAPVLVRIVSGFVDLLIICLISSPVIALVRLAGLDWQDARVITFAALTFVVMGFLYFTITTALTGRTLGMRLFALRVVDARTGLIPTGTQSASRALIYMLSVAAAGIALIFTLIDRDGYALHDRFSRTAVVRM